MPLAPAPSLSDNPALPRHRTREANVIAKALTRLDGRSVAVRGLVFAVVVYLGVNGGGYDLIVRNQVGIAIWWALLVCAIVGLLSARAFGRTAWAGLALFSGFVAWTAIATTWSVSSERSLAQLSMVACYLGILFVAVAVHRDREHALRDTAGAVAAAIAVVALLALISRLWPGTFAGSRQTANLLPDARSRLSWPLNYWNALAALIALGLPLLLGIATTSRRILVQALAAGAIPLLALCGYLTLSRGGAIEAAIALVVFILLVGERLAKLLTMLAAGGGSAVLIAGAVHRHALQSGLVDAVARTQGRQLTVVVVLVCAGTALAQAGIGLATRHGTAPGWLAPSPRRTRAVTAAAVVILIAAGLAVGVPSRLSRDWRSFKQPATTALSNARGIDRFAVVNGNDRYQFWQAAVDAADQRLLQGWGPGTYALLWPPRATLYSPIQNAHSLYFETLAEEGIVGLAALVGFVVFVVGAAIRAAIRSRDETRVLAAAIAAALCAFAFSAGVDWLWQIAVLPCAFLLLAGAVMARPARRLRLGVRTQADRSTHDDGLPQPQRRWTGWTPGAATGWTTQIATGWIARIAMVLTSAACLVAVGIPLAETQALGSSQLAAAQGSTAVALADARTAASVEPSAASPQLQIALVLELQHRFTPAIAAARRAVRDETLNWGAWVVLSRLEAEAGHPKASAAAFSRARSLNPTSPLFKL
jgi:hypothetical protein